MKKSLFYVGTVLAIAFSLTGCQKEVQNLEDNNIVIKKGIPFEIVARPVETRTENDGMNTKWVTDDAISVFHSIAGGTSYVEDGEFTITNPETNSFNGEVAEPLEEGKTYDWYMVYPYNSYLHSIANTGDNPARYYIGKRSDEAQEQNGNNSKAHLAGSNYPLFGVQKGVAYNEKPSLSVNHIASYIEVKVTNSNDNPLTVESVSFTAPDGEKIVGQYNIDFSQEPMTFTMYKTYASETANLTVSNGSSIAKGESASFFLGIKPFIAASGKVLKVSVNGYEKEIELTKQTTFTAGKIKKINFNYDYDPTAFADATFIFNTSAGLSELGIAAPGTSAGTVLDGKTYLSNNISLAFDTNGAGTDVRVWNSNGTYDLRTYANNKLTFTAPEGFNITSIVLSGSKTGNFTSAPTGISSGTWSGEAMSVVLKASNSGNINTITVKCSKAQVVPTIVNKEVTDLAAPGNEYSETIMLTNYETIPELTATTDGVVVTSASVSEVTASSATVTYTVSNNVSGSNRSGKIALTDSHGVTGEINVGQKADIFTVSPTEIELAATADATKTLKVTSDYPWTIDDALVEGFTVSPMSGEGSSSAVTLTVTSTDANSTANDVELGAFAIKRAVDNKETETITVSQKSAKLTAPTLNISGDASAKTITVSWDKNNNAVKYMYYVLDSEMEYKVEETTTSDNTTTSFTINDITLDETYSIAVKAIGNNDPWIDSDEAVEEYVVSGGVTTYQHVFTVKPSTGSEITLSGVKWNIEATNLGSYNSQNYAGVQIGSSKNDGEIKLTSSSDWGFEGKSTITEVRLWLNLGGTSVTPTVTIGGQSAVSDGTTVVKNSGAGSDYTKATKVTFTPAANGNTGVVVIDVNSVKAGYICAIEIDCQ